MRANEIFFPRPLAIAIADDIERVKHVDAKKWNDGSEEVIVRFRFRKEELLNKEAYFNQCNTQLETTIHSLNFSSYLISDWNGMTNDPSCPCPCVPIVLYIFLSIFTFGVMPLLDWLTASCDPYMEGRLVYTRHSDAPLEEKELIETAHWPMFSFSGDGAWVHRQCVVETGFMRGQPAAPIAPAS